MKTDSCLYGYSKFLIVTLLLWTMVKVSPAHLETIAKPEETDNFAVELEKLEDEILRISSTLHNTDAFAVLTKSKCPKKLFGNYSCWNVNGECYCLITESKTWWAALNFCRQYGMELVSFKTKEEETNFAKHYQLRVESNEDMPTSLYYQTSGSRLYGNRTQTHPHTEWMWASSGTLLNWNLIWAENQPSGVNGPFREDCLNFVVSKTSPSYKISWNDFDCDYHGYYFMCEFSVTKNPDL